jgi:hypothetical protein
VRHVVINAQQYTEYFARSAVLNEVKRFLRVQNINVLRAERVTDLAVPVRVVAVPLSDPCLALPTQALIGGSMFTEAVSADANEDTAATVQASEEYAVNEVYDNGINRGQSIEQAEPDMHFLSLEDYADLCNLRRAWFRRASELKVSFSDGVININSVFQTDMQVEADSFAGEPVSSGDAVVELWHLDDVELWAWIWTIQVSSKH